MNNFSRKQFNQFAKYRSFCFTYRNEFKFKKKFFVLLTFFFEFEHLLKKKFNSRHVLKLNCMKKFLIFKILIKNKKNYCVFVICRFQISFDLFFDFVLLLCIDFWLSDWCYHWKFFQKRKITECWFNENWFFQNRKKITRYI